MKKLAINVFLLLFLLSSFSLAQVPGQINYQGFLKNGSETPVSGIHSMRFAIYSTPNIAEPNWLWVETQTVTVDAGLYSVQLGLTAAISPGVFDGLTKYLGVKVDNDPEMEPRIPLISVPYAFRSQQVGCLVASDFGVGTKSGDYMSWTTTASGECVINNSVATKDSLIFVFPMDKEPKGIWWVVRADDSFTVHSTAQEINDPDFAYLIIN